MDFLTKYFPIWYPAWFLVKVKKFLQFLVLLIHVHNSECMFSGCTWFVGSSLIAVSIYLLILLQNSTAFDGCILCALFLLCITIMNRIKVSTGKSYFMLF